MSPPGVGALKPKAIVLPAPVLPFRQLFFRLANDVVQHVAMVGGVVPVGVAGSLGSIRQ
jgi:hypothetical protein